MEITFHKMHGLGNDFVLLDLREQHVELTIPQMVNLADRRRGIGCDQILSLHPSTRPGIDAIYKIFNQDGSVAEHCGNGVRCVARYLNERLPGRPQRVVVEINGSDFDLSVEKNGQVRVNMGLPILEPHLIPAMYEEVATRYELEINAQEFEVGIVSMGNPHVVFAVANVDDAPVHEVGRALQSHRRFPKKVNVGFMQIIDRETIRLRVFERGAGETEACGTGACAAMVVGRLWQSVDEAVKVRLNGGELVVEWGGGGGDPVCMTGPATYVYEGRITV